MNAADAPRHVLVVDDSRAQRHMVSMQLHRWGYRVSECDSGFAALDLCRTQSIDIILSDWMMPGMDGLAAARAIRAHFARTAPIARTAGWVSHWQEMISDPHMKIGRPRQLFTGATARDIKR